MEKYLVKTVNNIEADATGNVDGNSLGFIPLSGTEIGKPVTGIIEIEGDNGNQIKSTFDNKSSGVSFNGHNSTFFATDNITGLGTGISIYVDNIDISCSNPTSRGLISVVDYTANITDLDYTQKKYVDTHIAFTTVPTSSTDTGVKGQMAVDTTYLYVCVATDTWTRVALIW